VFRCDYGGLDARGDVELAQDVLDMDLDRGFGDAELAADFLVAGAAGDAAQDCKFNLPCASGSGYRGLTLPAIEQNIGAPRLTQLEVKP
jgi:hypothetical protein